MREDMKRRGIAFEGVETEAQTRCCTTLINRATGEVTELVESAPPVKPQELETLRQAILAHSDRSTIAVLSGSMPPSQSSPMNHVPLSSQQRIPSDNVASPRRRPPASTLPSSRTSGSVVRHRCLG